MTAHFSSFPSSMGVLIQGSSRGLGLALLQQALASEKVSRVIATSRQPELSDALADLKEEHSERLQIFPMDVTDEESIQTVARAVKKLDQEIHLIFNVAGVLHDERRKLVPEKKLEELRPENALYTYRVNALGPLLVAKHFLPFLSSKRAVIANLSARVGSIGNNDLGGWYSYRASKAAQNMFTRTLSIELGRYRKSHEAICVALHPGTMKTDLSAPFRRHIAEEKIFSPDRAASQLLEIIDGLTAEDQGKFIAWDGSTVPW